jgi:hypothetical protein
MLGTHVTYPSSIPEYLRTFSLNCHVKSNKGHLINTLLRTECTGMNAAARNESALYVSNNCCYVVYDKPISSWARKRKKAFS